MQELIKILKLVRKRKIVRHTNSPCSVRTVITRAAKIGRIHGVRPMTRPSYVSSWFFASFPKTRRMVEKCHAYSADFFLTVVEATSFCKTKRNGYLLVKRSDTLGRVKYNMKTSKHWKISCM